MNLGDAVPFYVTRKNADGLIATWSASAWMPLLAMLLVWLNIIAWSVFGLYEVVHLAFG